MTGQELTGAEPLDWSNCFQSQLLEEDSQVFKEKEGETDRQTKRKI